MKVKFLKDYRDYLVGDTPDLPVGIARSLVDGGYAEETEQVPIKAKDAEAVEPSAPQLIYGITDSGALVGKDGGATGGELSVPENYAGVTYLHNRHTEAPVVSPVIPLIPAEEPDALEKRKAKYGAGYSEKTKGSRK